MRVKKAVIPAAGLGTRFLPATKALPKELLPILDKPMLQYVVEEAAEAGIEEVIVVTARGKESIAAYFQPNPQLEQHLRDSGVPDLTEKVRHASHLAEVSFVIQEHLRRVGPNYQHYRPRIGAQQSGRGEEFHPAIADCGCRAPLAPRLARSP